MNRLKFYSTHFGHSYETLQGMYKDYERDPKRWEEIRMQLEVLSGGIVELKDKAALIELWYQNLSSQFRENVPYDDFYNKYFEYTLWFLRSIYYSKYKKDPENWEKEWEKSSSSDTKSLPRDSFHLP